MYDVKKEKDYDFIRSLLMLNEPIMFYGFEINILSVRNMILIGDKFDKNIIPFLYNRDVFPKFEKFSLITTYYLLSELQNQQGEFEATLINNAINGLKYFLKEANEVKIIENENSIELVIEGVNAAGKPIICIMDEKMFLEFGELLRLIYGYVEIDSKLLNKIKEEEEQENKWSNNIKKTDGKRFKNLMKLIHKDKEREQNKKQGLKIIDKYSYVLYETNIDYDKLKNFNIYQLNNQYEALIIKDGVNFNYRVATSGFANADKLDLTPFCKKIEELNKLKN